MRAIRLGVALKNLALGGLLAIPLACVSPVPVESYTYACAHTVECAEGWLCVQGRCSLGTASPQDAAPGPDASAGADMAAPDSAADVESEVSGACPVSDATCLTNCAASKCAGAAYVCMQDADCNKVLNCYLGCGDMSCKLNCVATAPSGSKTKVDALATCLTAKCL